MGVEFKVAKGRLFPSGGNDAAALTYHLVEKLGSHIRLFATASLIFRISLSASGRLHQCVSVGITGIHKSTFAEGVGNKINDLLHADSSKSNPTTLVDLDAW